MATAEVNAAMGRIVAAPTAGSCGVLPAVLCVGAYSTDQAVDALFTASAVGMIIAQNASVSGAQGGCQAEIGAASAMAAAALCELHGGAPEAALHAAATALQNLMGLVCDPVAGLVEVPCVKRNALGALNALLCADMALCAITTPIPFDQTVGAMHAVGCAMPQSLRESAMGGIAATDAARDIERRLFEPETPIPEDLGR
jgi:L-serine dehydratase